MKPGDVAAVSAMNLLAWATLPVTKPVAIGIGVAALIGLYLAFKLGKFLLKLLLWLIVLAALGLAAWWYYTTHYASP